MEGGLTYYLHCTLGQKQGEKDINSKIVEKGKIMNLWNGFQSSVMNQNNFKDFCYRFERFSHEILREF